MPATGIAIVAFPAMPTGPMLSVPLARLLVNVAALPLTPAIESVPAPSALAVRLPPGPIETVPLLAMLVVTGASTLSVPAAPTVAPPAGIAPDEVTRTVPAETLRLLNVLAPPSSIAPGPLVVSAKVPVMGVFTISEYAVLLFVQVWFAPRMMPAAPVVFKGLRMNRVLPVTLLFTRMPVPEPMSVVADALIVTDITLLLLVLF